ncbi:MAG: galactose mutarotase [Clostridia bacterium]|nr:galactose mutarotase [Clostridia bacterium]
MSITVRAFGTTKEGEAVHAYRLQNSSGAWTEILDYGGTIHMVVVPDKENRLTDVCLGYDLIEEYEEQDGCLGALVGRCANRIAKGRFTLDGREYSLAVNNGPNHLHGGLKGFDRRVWNARTEGDTLILARTSPDGEEGYPGEVEAEARYTWTERSELILECRARTDAPTLVNLTNHCYWNLNGQGDGGVGDHTVQVDADATTENDESCCPNGKLYPVEGTPLDLRAPKRLSDGWDADDPQITIGCGYDQNFALNGSGLRGAAVVVGDKTGIVLTLSTTLPGLQVYTANSLTDRAGKGGVRYGRRDGVALEAQGFPNAVNCPGFPSVVLRPGEEYREKIVFAFS